jgi:hypothetical protein
MKNSFLLAWIVLFSVAACSESSNPVESIDEGSLRISGKISNFDGHFNKVYISLPPLSSTQSYFESEITTDGSFDITIAPPADEQLIKYIPRSRVSVINNDTTFYIDSLRIADEELKYRKYGLSAHNPGSINHRISYSLPLVLGERKDSIGLPTVGDYLITYHYFNRQTKIEGFQKWKIVTSNRTGETVTNFNINTKVGWNLVMTKFLSDENDKSIYEVTDVDAESGEWMIGTNMISGITQTL